MHFEEANFRSSINFSLAALEAVINIFTIALIFLSSHLFIILFCGNARLFTLKITFWILAFFALNTAMRQLCAPGYPPLFIYKISGNSFLKSWYNFRKLYISCTPAF